MPQSRLRLARAACIALPLLGACASSGRAGGLDPRFVAVHNTLVAMGLAQVGPIHEGTLAEGREARAPLDLPAGCTTIVALGGDGLRDLDAQLLDAQGKPLAHDTTSEPQATLRACPESAGTYVLVVHATAGAGSWVAAAWQGGAPGPVGSSTAPSPGPVGALGTCDSPIPLSPGTVAGSTSRGEDANTGSCERSDAREIVYELDVTQRQRVVVDIEAHFDSVLYIRKERCSDADAEVDCNDDAQGGGRNRSRIERVLEPGKYFVFVDGYNQEGGSYKLTLSTSEVLSLSDMCKSRRPLAAGAVATGSTVGKTGEADAHRGGGADASDVAWRLDVPTRSRVRVVEHSDDVSPVLHVRRSCADEQSEIGLAQAPGTTGDAAVTGIFEPGAYTVLADSRESDPAGGYSLVADLAPPGGEGVPGDGCGDAIPLGALATATGDTFAARDDVAGTCGGAGSADVVYRLDVPHRSRFSAQLEAEEAQHVLVLWSRCNDRGGELGCGRGIDEVLAPGTYFLGVDGASPAALGRFTLTWALQDMSQQAAVCASAPTLVNGRKLDDSTAGGGDRFTASCGGGSDVVSSGPDRVFRFSLQSRSRVKVSVRAQFDATLELRKACADLAGGAGVVACEGSSGEQLSTLERVLEAGSYWVLVDGQTPSDQGPFTLRYEAEISAR